ncbi:MAG: hypothetical protein U0235_03145 [Polyangiaceae bacterium]
MNDALRRMRAALLAHLVPRVRALGFSGGLAGLRRKAVDGVVVLVIQTFKGAVQLDAGRVTRRGEVAARTVREDWSVYASPRAAAQKRASRRRLEDEKGKGVFRFDHLTSARECAGLAKSLAAIVESDGVRFWGVAVPRESPAARSRRVAKTRRVRASAPSVAALVDAGLVALGFEGAVKGTSGAFRRETASRVELVSIELGSDEALVQVATRKPGRRTGQKTPTLDFIHAADRDDLMTRPLARGEASAHARAIVAAVSKHFRAAR